MIPIKYIVGVFILYLVGINDGNIILASIEIGFTLSLLETIDGNTPRGT